ncbi:MAG: hypothetical protein KDA88_15760 [Planctomycetaceae bacterium]|nr:hypothetical protein [Planctomycetaceae bacterium]MCB9951733.1 hypothetical protein [Planctomycetaceae bacterium]
MWFAETAWPTLIVLATVAAIFVSRWMANRRAIWLGAAGFFVALMPLVWWLEIQIVTPREQVEQSILDITSAFQQKDSEETLKHISPGAPHIKILAAGALKLVDVSDDMRVSDIQIELTNEDSIAKAKFRVNARVGLLGQTEKQHQPTRWDATWRKEGEEWLLFKITELDPITGEPLDRFGQLRGMF